MNEILLDRLGDESFQRLQQIERDLPGADDVIDLCVERLDIRLKAYFFDPAHAGRYAGDQCTGTSDAVKAAFARQQLVSGAEIASLGEWDWRPLLSGMTKPALYIHPAFDLVNAARALEYIKALPNSRLVIIDRSGHMPYYEQPDAFFGAVRPFLAGQWPDDAVVVPGN